MHRVPIWFLALQLLSIVTPHLLSAEPTIQLSNPKVLENADTSDGTEVGTLTVEPKESDKTYTFSLIRGTGGDDIRHFEIRAGEDKLRIRKGVALDYEMKPKYRILVKAVDATSDPVETSLEVFVDNVFEAPEDIELEGLKTIKEDAVETKDGKTLSDFTLGELILKPQEDMISTLQLVDGEGDNRMFKINDDDELILKKGETLDFETKNSYTVIVRAQDDNQEHNSFDKTLTIKVDDVNVEGISSTLKPENKLVLKLIKSNFELPSTVTPDETFWIDEALGQAKGAFNIYLAHDIEEQAQVVIERLRRAYEDSTDNDSARDKIRFLIVGDDGEERLYKALESEIEEEREAFTGWVRLVLAWHNKVITESPSRYRDQLFQAYSVAIPSLVQAIITTHEQADGATPSGTRRGGSSDAEPSFYTHRIMRYLRHRDSRKAHREWQQQRYGR